MRSKSSKHHSKVGKTAGELKTDEQLAYSNRLAVVRAKAMAIIMNLDGEHSCMDEVHILIGPKVDVKIKMMVDGYGDIDEQVFSEDCIQHVPGKFGVKGNVMYITVPVEERDKKFIMDWSCLDRPAQS